MLRKACIPTSRLTLALLPPITKIVSPFYQRSTMATIASTPPNHSQYTSGQKDPVWVHTDPYSNRPRFPKLAQDLKTNVCVVGSGISGISIAYELVLRGLKVVMIDAREPISGESGRTSGHLANALDDGYVEIAKKHGFEGAKAAAESHTWALNRVGQIVEQLGISCEYRKLPGIDISQYPKGDQRHDEEMKGLKEEGEQASKLGLDVTYHDGYAVKGWTGKIDQRDALIFHGQATFHPTKYLVGVLKWLAEQPNFSCYTRTRMTSIKEKGVLNKEVHVTTDDGYTITCQNAVEATCIPLQKLSVVAELGYYRSYCIAIRVPKGSIEDCLLYDQADAYKYIRFTHCDEKDDYLVIGGCDHKVGQESEEGRFKELEDWVRARFTQAGSVDYQWSGQIFEPIDYMAFIGKNSGNSNIYIVTGDSGNGLTHGVIAGRLIADEIQDLDNPWSKLYNPKRMPPISRIPEMLKHDLQINTQYKRFLQSDITDIEDLAPGTGGVLNTATKAPTAVYKDDDGRVHQFSAVCPHMHGVVCWNNTEKSWDCPVHGSRFSKDGLCITGPAISNLKAKDDEAKVSQQEVLAT
jgi:glycine/D-amino acid oxidase-like deaminating enzyme/nitrite reductase/ring-hydroxylating ferredoxin subunit